MKLLMIKNFKIFIFSFFILLFFSCSENNYDVIVVGGGASGISAAVQSSRMGSKTLLIENTNWLGGMLTSAGVSAMDGNYKLPSGFLKEFRDSLVLYYGHLDSLKTGWVSNVMFEPNVGNEIFKSIANNEENLTIKFNSSVKKIVKKDKYQLHLNDRPSVYNSTILIDATELGDLIPMLNLPYYIGMDSKSRFNEEIAPESSNDIIQDLTYVMILKDYNEDVTIKKPLNYSREEFLCSYDSGECKESDKVLWSKDKLISYGKLPNGRYMINWPIEGNDYYSNSIEMNRDQRLKSYEKAKQKSLRFLYFIQTEMNFNNLSIDYDHYSTEDGFPLIPYHRESRRSHGLVTLDLNDVKSPYSQEYSLYRTGIAVGDYPVDHHHGAYTNYNNLPRLDFYPVPSYSVPLGSLIPKNSENFLVIEKSISVSNLVNGTTRLQPVVMLIGQAAGFMAGLAIKNNSSIDKIKIRNLQGEILDNGGYILPYIDVEPNHPNFIAYQKIGACGILQSEGKNIGWENKTFFYPDKKLIHDQLFLDDWDILDSVPENLSVKNTYNWIVKSNKVKQKDADSLKELWERLNLSNYKEDRIITRGEFSVLLDYLISPFSLMDVDYFGNLDNSR